MKKFLSIAIFMFLLCFVLSGCTSSQQTSNTLNSSQNTTTAEQPSDGENDSTIETVRVDNNHSAEANISSPKAPSVKEAPPAKVSNNPDAPISVEDAWYEISSDEYFKLFIFFRNISNQKFTKVYVYYDVINEAGDIIYSDYNHFDNMLDCNQACTIDDYVSRSETGDSLLGIRISKIKVYDLSEKSETIYVDPPIIVENIRFGKFAEVLSNNDLTVAADDVSSAEIEPTEMTPAECDHNWKEANCTAPKTCTKCGQTEGNALGHNPGDWEYEKVDFVKTVMLSEKKCTRCGEIVERSEQLLDTLYNGSTFVFNAVEYTARLKNIFSNPAYTVELVSPSDDNMGITIRKSGTQIAGVFFACSDDNNGNFIDASQKDERIISNILTGFSSQDETDRLNVIVGLIISCDPHCPDIETATELTRKILNNALKNQHTEENGLIYSFQGNDNSDTLIFQINVARNN